MIIIIFSKKNSLLEINNYEKISKIMSIVILIYNLNLTNLTGLKFKKNEKIN